MARVGEQGPNIEEVCRKEDEVVQNSAKLWEFEKRLIASEPPDHGANLRLADEMWLWAQSLGGVRSEDLLEGVEIHTRMAKVFQSVRRTP